MLFGNVSKLSPIHRIRDNVLTGGGPTTGTATNPEIRWSRDSLFFSLEDSSLQ